MYIDCIHACMYYLYTQSVFMLIPRKNEFREEEPAAAADSLGGGGMSPGEPQRHINGVVSNNKNIMILVLEG